MVLGKERLVEILLDIIERQGDKMNELALKEDNAKLDLSLEYIKKILSQPEDRRIFENETENDDEWFGKLLDYKEKRDREGTEIWYYNVNGNMEGMAVEYFNNDKTLIKINFAHLETGYGEIDFECPGCAWIRFFTEEKLS